MLTANAIKHTKDVFIKYLRAYLKNYENYSYFCENDYSNAIIYDTEPQDLRRFPAIVIVGGNGQLVTGGLGDFAEEIRDPATGSILYHRYGGMYELTLSIDIGARTTKDRELLADLITLAYRVHLRRFMQKEGVLVKDMRYGGESETVYDSDKIYIASIQVSTWSEWYQDFELLDTTNIKLDME